MLFLIALAHTLLTLLRAASEASGLDRTLKTNTSPKRTMSLFNQGLCWYQSLPNMREEWLEKRAHKRALSGVEEHAPQVPSSSARPIAMETADV